MRMLSVSARPAPSRFWLLLGATFFIVALAALAAPARSEATPLGESPAETLAEQAGRGDPAGSHTTPPTGEVGSHPVPVDPAAAFLRPEPAPAAAPLTSPSPAPSGAPASFAESPGESAEPGDVARSAKLSDGVVLSDGEAGPAEVLLPAEMALPEQVALAEEIALGAEVAELAAEYVGAPYVWGGASPRIGFDCTGFVQWVFGQFGISLPRTEAGQWASGPEVAAEELQPGDVLIFANTYRRGLSHTGIYLGEGQFVHAVDEWRGVAVSDLWSGYWAPRLVGASRPTA